MTAPLPRARLLRYRLELAVGRKGQLQYTEKSFSIFPSPTGMSLTKVSLGGNNDVIYKLFPPRESLESDIPAGDGNIEKLFYGVLTVTL